MVIKAEIKFVIRRTVSAPDGGFIDVYEVQFVTPSGIRDRVELPIDEYTPELAREKVDELSAKHEKLLSP